MPVVLRLACLLVAVTALGGKARAETPPLDYAAIHVIGVVSQLDDEANIQKTGSTIFGDRLTKLPIADWRMNELVAGEVVKALADRFTIKVLSPGAPVLKHGDESPLQRLFRGEADPFVAMPESGVDAYLAFLPGFQALPYPAAEQVEGLGMVHDPRASSDAPGAQPGQFDGTAFGGHPGSAVVFAVYDIYLVDAKTGHVLAVQRSETPVRYHQTLAQVLLNGATFEPVPFPRPHEYVPTGLWSNNGESLTDVQKAELREKLSALLKQSVSYSIAEMGLPVTQWSVPPVR
jgi:hypothetical protein